MGDILPGLEPQAEIDDQRATIRRATRAVEIARACVHVVDHGAGPPLTLDQAEAAVAHPVSFLPKRDLPALVAALACQVVGARKDQSADALLAMHRVGLVVDEWRQRHANASAGSPQPAPAGGETTEEP